MKKIRTILVAIYCLCFYAGVFAGDRPLSHELTVLNTDISITIDALEPSIATNSGACTIPFTLAGKLIIVQGRADSMQGNFILDTGAPNLVLNNTYFRNYTVATSNAEQEASITGLGDLAKRITIRQFQLGTLDYNKTIADLISLGHIEDSRKIKVLGLLGVSLFKDCELIIDFQNQLIHIYRMSKKEKDVYIHPMLAEHKNVSSMSFELRENRILLNTEIGGRKLQFAVDYAAESNVIDSRLPERILDSVKVTGRVMLTGTGLKKIEALTGSLSGLTVGEMNIPAMPFVITNLENTCFGTLNCINGVLGHDFLRGYTLVFNFARRKLYILN